MAFAVSLNAKRRFVGCVAIKSFCGLRVQTVGILAMATFGKWLNCDYYLPVVQFEVQLRQETDHIIMSTITEASTRRAPATPPTTW